MSDIKKLLSRNIENALHLFLPNSHSFAGELITILLMYSSSSSRSSAICFLLLPYYSLCIIDPRLEVIRTVRLPITMSGHGSDSWLRTRFYLLLTELRNAQQIRRLPELRMRNTSRFPELRMHNINRFTELSIRNIKQVSRTAHAQHQQMFSFCERYTPRWFFCIAVTLPFLA